MFPIFLCNKKCRLEHVVNKLMSCLITEFVWIFPFKLHGILSNPMGTLWHSMELHRYFREPLDLQGNSMEFHGIPWNSVDAPWISINFHGIPWNSMDFCGIPWRYFTWGKQLLDSGLELPAIINVLATCLFRTSPKSHPIQCKCLIIILLLTVYDQNSVLLCFLYKRI